MNTRKIFAQATSGNNSMLFHSIKSAILSSGAKSLLDIQAGGGAMAVPFFEAVKKYVALEEDIENTRLLYSVGIKVVNSFPLGESFNFVLCRHSVAHDPSRALFFVHSAWGMLESGGELLVITDRGNSHVNFNVVDFLSAQSTVRIEKINHPSMSLYSIACRKEQV